MKVIFLKDVARVGRRNDLKEVNDGYALNFLIPRGFAEKATDANITKLKQRESEIKIQKEIQNELLEKYLDEIKEKIVSIKVKADDKGHLFSGIHKKEILSALSSLHKATFNEEYIILEKPIKEIGEFEIPIVVREKKSYFKLKIERDASK